MAEMISPRTLPRSRRVFAASAFERSRFRTGSEACVRASYHPSGLRRPDGRVGRTARFSGHGCWATIGVGIVPYLLSGEDIPFDAIQLE